MGTRTKRRGDDPATYSDAELDQEIARVTMRLGLASPLRLSSSLRKSIESRLHNLRREKAARSA